MCFPGRGTYFTRDTCFPGGEHISLGKCVSQAGEHISQGICVSQVGEHVSLGTEGGSQLFETAEKGVVVKNGLLKGGGSCKYVSLIM